ncbi:MAG: hypothetical protein U0R24_15720 [Solirubrobacterales bacterium]
MAIAPLQEAEEEAEVVDDDLLGQGERLDLADGMDPGCGALGEDGFTFEPERAADPCRPK